MAEAVNRTDAYARPFAFRAYLAVINGAGAVAVGEFERNVLVDAERGERRA